VPKPHTRYGAWTFGWIEAERQIDRAKAFNERWQHLMKVRELIYNDFVTTALAHTLTPTESAKLCEYNNDMEQWQIVIANDIEIANQHDLNKYATSIKKTALKAIKLCIKYKLYSDITSVQYNAETKTIQINNQDWYYLGNGQTPPKKRKTKAQAAKARAQAAKAKADEEDQIRIWTIIILAIFGLLYLLQVAFG
jgi:hypothetical protein